MRKRRTTPRSNISKNANISKQLATTLPEGETQSTRKIQAASVEKQKPVIELLGAGRSTLVSNDEDYLSPQVPPKPIISLEHPSSTTSTIKVATTFPHIVFDDLWIDILSFFAQVYLALYEMTLGIGKWWAGTEIEDSHRGKETKEKEIKAKRRRRRVEPSSNSSGRFFSFSFSLVILYVWLVYGWETDSATGRFFPGMVNLSGTLCYMNSVLQVGFIASASHASVGPYLMLLLVCRLHTLTHHPSRKSYRFGGRSGHTDPCHRCSSRCYPGSQHSQ